jgi:hypothetical protein
LTASRVPPLAVAVFAFGALTRIVGFLQNASLSGDEAMLGLNIGRRGFLRLLQPLDYGQVATIPFLWAERLLVLLGGVSGYSLRVVPLLAGIGLLWVLYRLAAEVTGRVEALVALALVGTAFPLIRYSVEVKPYIVDAFVATVLVWTGCRVAEDLGNRRNWLRLALGGVAAVLVSTPALLVSGAVAGGLAVTALRARRTRALVGLGAILTCWLAIFGVTYATWYAPNARAPYMRDFWSQAILRLGTPHLISRSWLGLEETGCTLTCWRGLVDVTPLLILLTCIGVAGIWRRRGPDYAILVAGPLAAAFGASAVGQYPIAARLVLFAAPLLAIMVATGLVGLAERAESMWPRIRSRWLVMAFLYPSVMVAAVLTFVPPPDWGIRGLEVRPLADDFRVRSRGEPIYVFARVTPPWVFHTTDWSRPDTARLAWVARIAGPDGPGFVNGASRGRRVAGDADSLVYRQKRGIELFGTPSGSQGRMGTGYTPPQPDPGWAENEARRIRDAARPYAWMVLSDYAHPNLDERALLMAAVDDAGGEVIYTNQTADAVLYRLRFNPPRRIEARCSPTNMKRCMRSKPNIGGFGDVAGCCSISSAPSPRPAHQFRGSSTTGAARVAVPASTHHWERSSGSNRTVRRYHSRGRGVVAVSAVQSGPSCLSARPCSMLSWRPTCWSTSRTTAWPWPKWCGCSSLGERLSSACRPTLGFSPSTTPLFSTSAVTPGRHFAV